MTKGIHQFIKKLDYRVPSHANGLLYMFGGISLIGFAILIASGIYMSQFYNPTPDGANSSIVNAITNVPLADFMRSIHYWVANLIVFLLLLHVTRVFTSGSYKKPRRLTWLTGVLLLGVTTIYIFIGSALKMDQEGVEAIGHLQESFNVFGLTIGLTNFGVPVITQMYVWHTTILLLVLIALLALHMVLIKIRGISTKAVVGAKSIETAGTGTSSFLAHLRRLSGFGLIFLAVSGLLAVWLPAPLGYPGVLGEEVTSPWWMFWPFFGLENIFGLNGLVGGMIGFFVLLAAVPFIDRNPYLHWKKRKPILAAGLIFAALTVGLAVYSRVQPPEPHLNEMSANPMTEVVTDENISLSHQRLRSEAYVLVPVLIAAGGLGTWLTFSAAGGPKSRRSVSASTF